MEATELTESLSVRVTGHIRELALSSAKVMERQVRGYETAERASQVNGRVLGDGRYEAVFTRQEIGRVVGLDVSGFEAISVTRSEGAGGICEARLQTSGYMDKSWGTPARATFTSFGDADGNVLFRPAPLRLVGTTEEFAPTPEELADCTARLATAQVAANIVDLTVRGCVPSEGAEDLRERIHKGVSLLRDCAQLAPPIEVDFLGRTVTLNAISTQPFLDCMTTG